MRSVWHILVLQQRSKHRVELYRGVDRTGERRLTFALASTDGGMTLSGPKACRGSTKAARILPHFLHSARFQSGVSACLVDDV